MTLHILITWLAVAIPGWFAVWLLVELFGGE